MTLLICPIQIYSQMRTKSHCIVTRYESLYMQQHPTRLGKQLHPQTVGLLFSAVPKYNDDATCRQLPQCVGNAA